MMKRIRPDFLRVFAWAGPITIFVCMIVGWKLNDRLYADVDGPYTKWNYQYAFEWGNWFDLSIFNPFAGLGSLFWTNTPWLNPGALALQLPFSPLATVTLSYLLHLAGLTFYCFGRAAGASKLAIVYALGLFILLWFPPYTFSWVLMQYSLAPFRLVTGAAANLILLRQGRTRRGCATTRRNAGRLGHEVIHRQPQARHNGYWAGTSRSSATGSLVDALQHGSLAWPECALQPSAAQCGVITVYDFSRVPSVDHARPEDGCSRGANRGPITRCANSAVFLPHPQGSPGPTCAVRGRTSSRRRFAPRRPGSPRRR